MFLTSMLLTLYDGTRWPIDF